MIIEGNLVYETNKRLAGLHKKYSNFLEYNQQMRYQVRRRMYALKHYIRMRDLALSEESTDYIDIVDEAVMKSAIGEAWYSENCSYCKDYDFNCKSLEFYLFERCPLYVYGKNIAYRCCNGLWEKLDNTFSWEDFADVCNQILCYIMLYG